MSHADEGGRPPLTHTREVTIDALMEHFANDVMDIEEFERRVEVAHRATTSDELKELLRDLPGSAGLPVPAEDGVSSVPAVRTDYSVTSAANIPEREFALAVMGGTSRTGHWRPARKNVVVAVMGGADLDFREAVLGPGITEVQVYTMWGGVDIVVPPGVNVECHGLAIMGGFESKGQSPGKADMNAPTIRITGVALMGGVDVTVRHPGETKGDARRRRKLERREQRRRLRRGRD
ncbi:MAG: DUF1707 domain-containing protein [Gemmatimonadota bacterium]